jgi:hypothetical protein
MNPGMSEEAGQTARSFIESMKSSPALLALVILQGITLAGIAWSVHERNITQQEERKQFLELQRMNAEMLSRCVVPDKTP